MSFHAAAASTILTAFALVSTACGGGAVWTPSPPTTTAWQTIVAQPATVAVYNDRSPPRGTVGVTRWQMRERPGDVWSAEGVVGISIDSVASTRPNLATIVMGTNLAEPIPAAGKAFRYSFDLRVLRADHSGAAVAQVVAYYSFKNRVTGQSRWHGLVVFDTRCGRSGTVEKMDPGTNRPIVNVVSPSYSCQPHDWRSFAFAPAIPLSADDDLRHINLNPETATAPGETARIDVEVRNWRLEIVP